MSIIDYKFDPCWEYFVVRILNFFICFVNFWTDLFLGWNFTFGSKADRRTAQDDYTKSAQIVDILFRGDYGVISVRRLHNFFFRHNRWVHPKYILENDNVTFYGFSRNHAYFCVSNPALDVTDSTIFPFMFLGQFIGSEQLIIMPIKHFHRLAAETPEYKGKIAHIHMTARCGSTLLAQIFRQVPGVRVMSEPWSYADAQYLWYRREWTQAETDKAVISATKVLLKPLHSRKVDFVILKHGPFSNQMFPVMFKAFPTHKWIFNTRLLRSAMMSFVKTANSQPKFYLWGPFFTRFYFPYASVPRDDPQWNEQIKFMQENFSAHTYAEKLALGGLAFYANYMRDKKHYDICTFYEDISKKPKEELTRIFAAIGMDTNQVDTGMKALKKDSQQGVIGARGHDGVVITEKEYEQMDKWYTQFGVPVSSKQTLEEMKKGMDL